MAAGHLSPPGTEWGPCEQECQHRDCAQTRRMAGMACRICGETIGYDRQFFIEGETVPGVGPTQMVHAVCSYREEGL